MVVVTQNTHARTHTRVRARTHTHTRNAHTHTHARAGATGDSDDSVVGVVLMVVGILVGIGAFVGLVWWCSHAPPACVRSCLGGPKGGGEDPTPAFVDLAEINPTVDASAVEV